MTDFKIYTDKTLNLRNNNIDWIRQNNTFAIKRVTENQIYISRLYDLYIAEFSEGASENLYLSFDKENITEGKSFDLYLQIDFDWIEKSAKTIKIFFTNIEKYEFFVNNQQIDLNNTIIIVKNNGTNLELSFETIFGKTSSTKKYNYIFLKILFDDTGKVLVSMRT